MLCSFTYWLSMVLAAYGFQIDCLLALAIQLHILPVCLTIISELLITVSFISNITYLNESEKSYQGMVVTSFPLILASDFFPFDCCKCIIKSILLHSHHLTEH